MKKLLLILLILLPCELGAQEGCGWWLKTRGCFNIQQLLEDEDSVWVPKPCPDVWDNYDDSVIVGLVDLPDTTERDWWKPPLDTIYIDTTCQIWENITHSKGTLSRRLGETTLKQEQKTSKSKINR